MNIISNYDNLKCKIGQYISQAVSYSVESGKTYVTCLVPSFKNTISTWDYSSDISLSVDLSNNGIDFSSSGINFIYVNQLTLITSISPYRGPAIGNTKISISLRLPIQVIDYNPICRFGNIPVTATVFSSTVLTCMTPSLSLISTSYTKCFSNYYCNVNTTFELQGNSYVFSYVYYTDPHVESIIPPSSSGILTPSTVVRGNNLFTFFESPLSRFTLVVPNTNSPSPISIMCNSIDYNSTLICSPPMSILSTGMVLPQEVFLEVSVNSGSDWTSDSKKYTFSSEDVIASMDVASGPNTGNTLLTIKYTNIFQNSGADLFRCKFSTSLNTGGYIIPATWDTTNLVIKCYSPPKNEIDGTEEGTADVSISSNSIAFSSTTLPFIYFREGVFISIDSPYLIINYQYTKKIVGTFPTPSTSITTKLKLIAVSTTRQAIVSSLSQSTTEITFQVPTGIFAINDNIQISASFNNGNNYQTTGFVLKGVNGASISSAFPLIISTGSSYVITLTGSVFYSIPLYCVIDSNSPILGSRISSQKMLCTIPSKSIETTSTINVCFNAH